MKQCMSHGECFGGECIYTSLPQRPVEPEPVTAANLRHTLTEVGYELGMLFRPQRPTEPVQEPDLSRCPQCGGPADNGHDRSIPPTPYFCTKCMAEPVEPVAWRWGYRSITTGEMDWRGYVEIASHPNLRSPAIIMEPLYAAPPQRKPLTEEEIEKAYREIWRDLPSDFDHTSSGWIEQGIRYAERTHGITP